MTWCNKKETERGEVEHPCWEDEEATILALIAFKGNNEPGEKRSLTRLGAPALARNFVILLSTVFR